MSMPVAAFCGSVLLGALVWLLSPALTGMKEPWDASPGYYFPAVFLAGFVPACFSARRYWMWAVGAWLGQLLGFVFLMARTGPGALWPLGLALLGVFSILSLVGAGAGAWLRGRLWGRVRRVG